MKSAYQICYKLEYDRSYKKEWKENVKGNIHRSHPQEMEYNFGLLNQNVNFFITFQLMLEIKLIPSESGENILKRSFSINAGATMPKAKVTFDLHSFFKKKGKFLEPIKVEDEAV